MKEYEKTNEINFKNKLLRNFKATELEMSDIFYDEEYEKFIEIVEQIVNILKKEELTYEQAYAALQQVYNQLKYESNFIKLSSQK